MKKVIDYINEVKFGANKEGGTYETVDLKLPSGTKWAKCNIGAKSPKEIGLFFTWGGLNDKKEYNWNNYELGINRQELDKYNSKDNKKYLDPEDDIAYKESNGKLHIPTRLQLEELINKEYTTINDKGYYIEIVSNTNGNSIIIPEYGYKSGSNYRGNNIALWTNEAFEKDCALSWYYEKLYNNNKINDEWRKNGLQIRACTINEKSN